jgi:hypothetical protein
MFDDNVFVKFEKDKEKFKKKAEELGYVSYVVDLSSFLNSGYLILWSESKSFKNQRNYSIIYSNPKGSFFREISQEEFFGVKMLEQLDLRVLSVLVNLTCETLNSFSAYDVTSILRSRLPSFSILHDDVRKLVAEYAQSNNLQVSDNGTYLTYTNPVKINFIPTVTVTTGVNTNNFKNKLPSLVNSVTTSTQSKLDTLLKEKQLKSSEVNVKTLQSEGRLNLTSLVRQTFPKAPVVYISRVKNKITLTPMALYNSSSANTNSEIRVRTGFNPNSKVNIKVTSQGIEITPQGN